MRGPKIRTAENSRPGSVRAIGRRALKSPSKLSAPARAEFRRLAEVLESNGTLERVDLAVLAEAARVKALLDQAHAVAKVDDARSISAVTVLTVQRRGLLRELGLTLQPSRSVIRTQAGGDTKEVDPIAELIKLHG